MSQVSLAPVPRQQPSAASLAIRRLVAGRTARMASEVTACLESPWAWWIMGAAKIQPAVPSIARPPEWSAPADTRTAVEAASASNIRPPYQWSTVAVSGSAGSAAPADAVSARATVGTEMSAIAATNAVREVLSLVRMGTSDAREVPRRALDPTAPSRADAELDVETRTAAVRDPSSNQWPSSAVRSSRLALTRPPAAPPPAL